MLMVSLLGSLPRSIKGFLVFNKVYMCCVHCCLSWVLAKPFDSLLGLYLKWLVANMFEFEGGAAVDYYQLISYVVLSKV